MRDGHVDLLRRLEINHRSHRIKPAQQRHGRFTTPARGSLRRKPEPELNALLFADGLQRCPDGSETTDRCVIEPREVHRLLVAKDIND
jgi:hypothetical protein